MNKLLTLCSLVVVLAVGCAGADVRPLVDMKGVNEAAYEKDLQECQAYAKDQSGMGSTATKGAAAGAVVGGLLGLVTGGNKTGIAQAAGAGAVSASCLDPNLKSSFDTQIALTTTISGVALALIAPVLGRRSDDNGKRKFWLLINTYILIAIMVAAFFLEPKPEYVFAGLVL